MSHDPDLHERLADLADAAGRAAAVPVATAIRRRGGRRVLRQRAVLTAVAALVVIGGPLGARQVARVHRPAPAVPPSSAPGPPLPQPTVSPVPGPPAIGNDSTAPTAATTTPRAGVRPSAHRPGSPATAVPPAASAVACARPDVVVSLGPGDASMGHRSVALVFTNRGPRPCRITGYPVVTAVDAGGVPVTRARPTPSGYLGGLTGGAPPDVTLAPGQQASALLEGLAPDGPCTAYAALSVALPDDPAVTRLTWATDACGDLQVHPVVPGGTGQLP